MLSGEVAPVASKLELAFGSHVTKLGIDRFAVGVRGVADAVTAHPVDHVRHFSSRAMFEVGRGTAGRRAASSSASPEGVTTILDPLGGVED
jgi:hypothetical protein